MASIKTLKRIAVLGPESSGKTTLCMQLSEYFHTVWVPEYARAFISSLDRPYTQEDILFCSQEQLSQEKNMEARAHQFIFCDTEFIISKVWCNDVFGNCPPWILEQSGKHVYDLYLLTAPDLPFEPDPLRENPHRREEFFEIYRKELESHGFLYEIISGIGKKRFQNAIKVIDRSA